MKRNLGLWIALVPLAGIHMVTLWGGFFAPYDFAAQDREIPFAPPTRLHFVDGSGQFRLRPYVCRWFPAPGTTAPFAYFENCSETYAVRFLVRGGSNPAEERRATGLRLVGVDDPARLSLLGTDEYGRDIFSRLIYGGRFSLFAGLLATILSLALGWCLGSVAGYYGAWVDEGLMRLTEVFLALPWLYLLFAVRAFLPLEVGPGEAFLLLTGIIGLVGWARPARLVRGVVLSAKERTYVLAARGFGASDAYLLRRHIWPDTRVLLLTQAALLVPAYIQAEVVMSFFGLGVAEPVPSWGNMLGSLQNVDVMISYWWMSAPALVLLAVCLLYHVLGTRLQGEGRP